MSQLATLHIDKQAHKFSAAHFTIFSETERERLHGHNYGVSARIVAAMGDNGFSADYNVCLLYTSPSPRDRQKSRMPSSA